VSYLIVLLLGILAAVLQSTLLRLLLPQVFVPDIMLLLVLYTSLLFPSGKGLLLSFALGLLGDLFSGAPEGLNALFSITLFVLSKAIQARVFLKGIWATVWLLVLALGLKVPYYALLSVVCGVRFPSAADALFVWLGEFLASLLVMPALFYGVSKCLGLPGRWFLQQRGRVRLETTG
jgi:rod shape-determining protein MreD